MGEMVFIRACATVETDELQSVCLYVCSFLQLSQMIVPGTPVDGYLLRRMREVETHIANGFHDTAAILFAGDKKIFSLNLRDGELTSFDPGIFASVQ